MKEQEKLGTSLAQVESTIPKETKARQLLVGESLALKKALKKYEDEKVQMVAT